jgi:hypothetical protein
MALEYDNETVPKLARFKRVRAGKWSLGSERSLLDMSDLAAYLLALERYPEVAELGEAVAANLVFKGSYILWGPGSLVIATGCRALRLLGHHEKARQVYNPIGLNPASVINRPIIEQTIREAAGTLGRGAWKVVVRNYITELEDAYSGRPGTEWYPVEQMEAHLKEALALARRSIEPKSRVPRT